ncbi:MAG: serine hydrolase domain-containing protein [Saprospiraceae bacterium]
MRSSFIGLWFFLITVGSTTAQNLSTRQLAVHDRVVSFRESGVIPGVAVAITHHGELIYAEGFGYADLENQVPVDPLRTKFRIGSISKSLTAAVLARQYQRGEIDLDATIQRYLPDYPVNGGKDRITLRLLGGHLAGMRHYRGEEFLLNVHYADVQSALQIFESDSLLSLPGSAYSYSSYGFNLLSAAMEAAAGKPFLQLMKDELFLPLGLMHTCADQVSDIIADRTSYYARDLQGNIINAPAVDNSYKWAGGGFIASATDLCHFAYTLLGEDFWKPSIRDQFIQSQRTTSGESTGYGIGFSSHNDEAGRHWFGHSGGSVGGTSNMVIYPEEELIIVVLTNASNVRIGQLNQELAALILD